MPKEVSEFSSLRGMEYMSRCKLKEEEEALMTSEREKGEGK